MNKISACLLATCLLASNSFAEEIYYVNDELTITMRSGASTQHQIIRTIKSGAKLNVIEIDKESGYTYARLDNGTEGWVITRYLSKTPIARDLLKQATSQVEMLTKQVNELNSKLNSTQKDRDSLDNSSSKLEKENTRLGKELARITEISGNAIVLDQDNKTMREQVIRMETEIQTLQQQNETLKDRSTRDWFVTGAIVTIVGIVIGLLVPRLRLKRKSNWNEL